MKAATLIPNMEPYPRAAILAGLSAAGIGHGRLSQADALVTWSPWNESYRAGWVKVFESERRPIIVVENGWLSPVNGVPYFQVALDGWNGTGRFPTGDASRWNAWGVPMEAWRHRAVGGTVLVCGQRGHHSDPRTSTKDWLETVQHPSWAGRTVVRRPREILRPLAADLEQAAECHVWSSNAATHAILAGVPVVQWGPNLMVSALASRPGEPLRCDPRAPVLAPLAWAQWSAEEIATGLPFARLMSLL
jgi:hypothetical protein